MSTLVVIGYDDQFKAEEVRLSLMKMQKDYLIDLEDAVVAVKDQEGKGATASGCERNGSRRSQRRLLGSAGRDALFKSASGHGNGGHRGSGFRRPHGCRHR